MISFGYYVFHWLPLLTGLCDVSQCHLLMLSYQFEQNVWHSLDKLSGQLNMNFQCATDNSFLVIYHSV